MRARGTEAVTQISADSKRLSSADTVEKLLFRSYSKNSRPVEASLLLGREGPGDPPLRATRVVPINAATIRGVNCQLQRTDARIRGHCKLEFFQPTAKGGHSSNVPARPSRGGARVTNDSGVVRLA